MTLPFKLSDVHPSDAESLARHVQIPAVRNTPPCQVMFPCFDTMDETQRNEVAQWYADMLREAVRN